MLLLLLVVSGCDIPVICTPPIASFPSTLKSIFAAQAGRLCEGLMLPWAGFFATGGGTLSDFIPPLEKAMAFDWSDTCMSSAAKLCFRLA